MLQGDKKRFDYESSILIVLRKQLGILQFRKKNFNSNVPN